MAQFDEPAHHAARQSDDLPRVHRLRPATLQEHLQWFHHPRHHGIVTVSTTKYVNGRPHMLCSRIPEGARDEVVIAIDQKIRLLLDRRERCFARRIGRCHATNGTKFAGKQGAWHRTSVAIPRRGVSAMSETVG